MSTLTEYLRVHKYKGPFKPIPHYNLEADCIEWYWKDELCYADPVHIRQNDGSLLHIGSVMRSMETHEAVGVKVYNIGYLMFIDEKLR